MSFLINGTNTKIGIVRGGPSSEHEVSLKTAEFVSETLKNSDFSVEDIFIDISGDWFKKNKKVNEQEALEYVDVVLNALHGEYGEDGKIQQVLNSMKIPYTGSGVFPSALAMNKVKTREFCVDLSVNQPVYRVVKKQVISEELLEDIFTTFPHPCVVKPCSLGSSVGVSIVQTKKELELALSKTFDLSETALVEEYIDGREATCGVVQDFREESLYALPVVQIRPTGHSFFDYDAKYDGSTEEIVPGNFSEAERSEMQTVAKDVHKTLGLRHYSRVDFVVHPKRGVFLLEANTLPGLTKESLFPKSLDAVGSNLEEFLEHILGLAMDRK